MTVDDSAFVARLDKEMEAFVPVPVERDELGFWFHPAYPDTDSESEAQTFSQLMKRYFERRWVEMDMDLPDDILAQHEDAEGVAFWNPTCPGEGFFLAAIIDDEDGPTSLWLKRRPHVLLSVPRFSNYLTAPESVYQSRGQSALQGHIIELGKTEPISRLIDLLATLMPSFETYPPERLADVLRTAQPYLRGHPRWKTFLTAARQASLQQVINFVDDMYDSIESVRF